MNDQPGPIPPGGESDPLPPDDEPAPLPPDDEPDSLPAGDPRASRDRRIAWRTAAVLILLNSLLNAITVIAAPARLSWAAVIPATAIDIFLVVNLWRDKKWARDWIIVRLILGLLLWGAQNYGSSGWAGVVVTVLITGSMLLVLAGRPRNWRTVIGATLFLLTSMTVTGLTLLGAVEARLRGFSPASLAPMQNAEDALGAGDHLTAIRLFGEVTRAEPENAPARYGLCRAYEASQNPSLAINACDKAVELAPNNAEIRAYQAFVLLDMRRYDEAQVSAEAALGIDDTNHLAYFVRAVVRANAGNLMGARSDFDKAIELAPTDEERANIENVADQILSQEGAWRQGAAPARGG